MKRGQTEDVRQQRMVEQQVAARGVRSEAVLEAMRRVPRAGFVPTHLKEFVYEDTPLPFDEGQTIFQPYTVAAMIEALELEKGDKVLEVGTGSGYSAAVLGEIAGTVYTIESYPSLAETARQRLEQHGYGNVHVVHGDGSAGYPDAAPYNAILVTAGAPEVPEVLRRQLAVGGRLVMPVGSEQKVQKVQKLVRLRRTDQNWFEEEESESLTMHFAPLVGKYGWQEPEAGGRPATRETRRTLP